LSDLFITGCDINTRWMLPWFEERFYKHMPDAKLKVFNFDNKKLAGWMNKPNAMVEATCLADRVFWIDTDCEIRSDISNVFDYIEPNKLCMGIDQPWTTRTGEKWHNSGMVGFANKPSILVHWAQAVHNGGRGDQEVLHEFIKLGLNRLIHITDLPKSYNTLRLDILDNTQPKKIKVMHHTGAKGKKEIKRQMRT